MATFATISSEAAHTKPTSGDSRSDLPTPTACAKSTPLVPVVGEINWFAIPTPMIEPISVCELDDGRPRYHVPSFQLMAATRRADTIATPDARPAC